MELRQLRDFSQNFNDTFQFIKQEFKPLVLSYFSISGILVLATGIVSGLYERNAMGGFFTGVMEGLKHNNSGYYESGPVRTLGSVFSPLYFLMLFLGGLNIIVMRVTVAVYMKIYDEKGKVSPTIEEIWKGVLRYTLPVAIYSFVLAILIVLGFCFCIAPGVYFMVVLAPITMVFVVEDASFGGAFNRCFALIKENFWISLAIYLVVYIIYSISSGIIGVVVTSLAGLISYFSTHNIAATVGVVTGIFSVFQYVFYIVFLVSVGLNYFNLSELHDGEGFVKTYR
ncbi:hypothetical protein F5148DRAFT_1153123 [Russula earlei]|uniref:Uncharacterized protein n=1 Tax=Russula earlei TaxID=71964 RepID=A0ACC0TV45_9AGAM|nr:hypothetical protein F5148DRAFT_1153123 [Russula earlei]